MLNNLSCKDGEKIENECVLRLILVHIQTYKFEENLNQYQNALICKIHVLR